MMLMRYSDARFRHDEFWCHVVSGQMVNSYVPARYVMAEAYNAS